jgi:predicted transcriptional regulator
MSAKNWKLLGKIQDEVAQNSRIPTTFIAALIRKVHAGISSSSKAESGEIAADLSSLLKQVTSLQARNIIEKLAAAESLLDPIEGAFLIGQLNFAHRMVADSFQMHVDDASVEAAKEERFRPYLGALKDRSLTGTELAGICNQRTETISRKLAELREYGLVECRRSGRTVVNFLTPLGRAIEESLGQVDEASKLTCNSSAAIEMMRQEVKPSMRIFTSFDSEVKAA